MVLKIIGIVLLCVLGIIALLLVLPFSVMLKKDGENFEISARFLFIKKNLTETLKKRSGPKDEKNAAPKKKKEKKAPQKAEKKQQAKVSPRDIIALSFYAVKELFRLFGRCRVSRLKVNYVAGGEDPAAAAMTYGGVCAAIYPCLGFLNSKMSIKKSGESINLRCDFEKSKSEFDFDICLRLRPFWALIAAVRVVGAYIKRKRSV